MLANFIYLTGLILISPIVFWRCLHGGRYRRGVSEKLLGLSKKKARELFPAAGDPSDPLMKKNRRWFHAVSVGEVNLLPGLIKSLEKEDSIPFVVSASTDTGYDLAVKLFGADRVFFCPLDFTWSVRRTLQNLQVNELILVELELWPNLIRFANQKQCQVKVINARLSQRSAKRYQSFPRLTRPLFAQLHWVGCQDSEVLEHFVACGTPRTHLEVTGSLKFDNAPSRRDTQEVIDCQTWTGQTDQHTVWLVGSTQADEEEMAIDIFQSIAPSHPNLRLIVVPRHAQRFDEVAKLILSKGLRLHRRSNSQDPQEYWEQSCIVLIDTIGELRNWWGTAQIATVGGSFGARGGQNMLEPAGYGTAVSFGPDTRNFKQIANTLLNADAACRVKDKQALKKFVERCLSDSAYRIALGERAAEIVNQHRGAIDLTSKALIRNPHWLNNSKTSDCAEREAGAKK